MDAGFDRARLVTFSLTLPAVAYQAQYRAQTYQEIFQRLREVPGVVGTTGMTGLPPERPLNANMTNIDGYEPPPEGPFEMGRSSTSSSTRSDGQGGVENQRRYTSRRCPTDRASTTRRVSRISQITR